MPVLSGGCGGRDLPPSPSQPSVLDRQRKCGPRSPESRSAPPSGPVPRYSEAGVNRATVAVSGHTGSTMDADPEVRTVTVDPVADPPTDGDEAGEVTVGPGAARRLRITSALMVVALVALAASTVLFTLPVTNPGVQSCGSPAWFLLQAESDAPLVDPDGQPLNGWDTERIQE